MESDQLRGLVQEALAGTVIGNWAYWVLYSGLTAMVAAIGAYGASFLTKRAETAAIQRDIKEVLTQLQRTTAVTTETRTAIERLDFLEREWRATRRQKLEQLLSSAYDLETWLEKMRDRWLHGSEDSAEPRALEKLKLLGALYFPELKTEVSDVLMAHAAAYQYILQKGSPAGEAKRRGDADGYGASLASFASGWPENYQQVVRAVARLEAAASDLMPKVALAE